MKIRNRKISMLCLLAISFALIASSCSSSSSNGEGDESTNSDSGSDSQSNNVSGEVIDTGIGPKQDFCETYRQALGNIGVDYTNAVSQAQTASGIVPSDAPKEVKEYFVELSDLLSKSETAEELLANQTPSITEREATLDGYMDDICGPFNSSSPDVSGPAATMTELKADGPSMSFEDVTIDIGSINFTNADPDSAVTDNPVATDTEYLMMELSFEATTSAPATFWSAELDLTMPDQTDNGFTTSPRELFYTIDDSSSISLNGNDSATVVAMFKMKDPLDSLEGMSFQIERDDGLVSDVLSLD